MFLTTCLDGVTADSPAQWQPFPREIGGRAMPIDGAFWRSLREDFESLQVHQFSLIWNSSPPLSFAGEPLDNRWSWLQFPDDSLRARLSAMALRGARALGYDSEEAWYDLLRTSGFVRFQLTGSTRQRRSDGVVVDWESGQINDVVKESITLCYELEVEAPSPRPLPTSQPGSLTLSARPKDLANVAEPESTPAAV
jgi:hypothetical protein